MNTTLRVYTFMTIKINRLRFNGLILSLMILTGGFHTLSAQCPTVTISTQSFCDLEAPSISDLIATDNGNGIQWYSTAISVTPLSGSAGLVDGEDYYADDNSGTCGVRERVDVIIYGPPTGFNFQGVCVDDPNDATISDLDATGNNVQWYNVVSGGTSLAPTTVISDNTIYYADQQNPDTGCRTSRLSVFVNVGIVPVPIGDPIQIFCSDSSPTVADLIATGADLWYSSISSVIPLNMSELLIDGQDYFATSFDPPCESIDRLEVVVVIEEPADPGISGSLDICESDINTILTVNLIDELTGTPDASGTWTGPLPTTNGDQGTLDITPMTALGSPYIFTYSVDSGIVCAPSTSTVTISIITEPIAGSDSSVDICSDDATQDLFNALGGLPDPGGTWSPALNSGSGLFDPAFDAPGDYTYTVTGTPPCGDASATVTVTIVPEPNAGIDTNAILCINDGAQDLFNFLDGNPDSGGSWSPTLDSGSGIFDPNVDAPGDYTYTIIGPILCNQTASAILTVSIEINLDASGLEISTNDICLGYSSDINLTNANLLPDGDYIVTYVLSNSNNSENSATVTFVNGNSSFNIPASLLLNSGTTTITIIGVTPLNANCSADVSLTLAIDFNILDNSTPEIIENGNTFCEEDEATIEDLTANILGVNVITWYDAPSDGTAYSNTTILLNGETYYASALTPDGCESLPRLEVIVTLLSCPEDITIPDGFSPNGDSINDDFNILNVRELYPKFVLEIYNRYGNILYKGNIGNPNWDGYSHEGSIGSSEVPVGVYFYILKFNDGIKGPIQGRVYLSR